MHLPSGPAFHPWYQRNTIELGQALHRRIIILIICFALTSVFVHRRSVSRTVSKPIPLTQALTNIKGWDAGKPVPLDKRIVDALQLDDYVNQHYFNGNESVFLYIGYYLTASKVGAVHDPLVCFPGQGWMLEDRQKGELLLKRNPADSISFTSMTVHRGEEKQIIVYWFQSYDQTSPDTLSQKIRSLWKRFTDHRQESAFVRISVPVEGKSLSEARQMAFTFMQSFYPVFLEYVRAGNT
ncbi:MAG: EpsI family protein [Thermodesulfobacteriota bacterium]|nr:EpsI family protein [Thermodesulfobacteriota bacterium]